MKNLIFFYSLVVKLPFFSSLYSEDINNKVLLFFDNYITTTKDKPIPKLAITVIDAMTNFLRAPPTQ